MPPSQGSRKARQSKRPSLVPKAGGSGKGVPGRFSPVGELRTGNVE